MNGRRGQHVPRHVEADPLLGAEATVVDFLIKFNLSHATLIQELGLIGVAGLNVAPRVELAEGLAPPSKLALEKYGTKLNHASLTLHVQFGEVGPHGELAVRRVEMVLR